MKKISSLILIILTGMYSAHPFAATRAKVSTSAVDTCIKATLFSGKYDRGPGTDKAKSRKLMACLKKNNINIKQSIVQRWVVKSRAVFSIAGSIGLGLSKEGALKALRLPLREMDEKKLMKYKLLIEYMYRLDSAFVGSDKFLISWFTMCLADYE